MLQQILKDMYIDPDVLDALNEEQKKTLFLKMRQEQVRRWQEREEKLEREGGEESESRRRSQSRKANRKSVSWLLGRDGEVAVVVIGEMDELSSKLISTGLGGKMAAAAATPPQSLGSNQTILKSRAAAEPARTEENQPRTQSQAKSEQTATALPLAVSGGYCRPATELSACVTGLSARAMSPSSPQVSVSARTLAATAAAEKTPPTAAEVRSTPSVGSRPLTRAGAINVRSATASAAPGCVNARAGSSTSTLTSTLTSTPSSSRVTAGGGAMAGTRLGLGPPAESLVEAAGSRRAPAPAAAAEASRKAAAPEAAGSSGGVPTCAGRGRVAQLMKTFGENASSPVQAPPRGVKPPLPNKPSHLRLATTPSVR